MVVGDFKTISPIANAEDLNNMINKLIQVKYIFKKSSFQDYMAFTQNDYMQCDIASFGAFQRTKTIQDIFSDHGGGILEISNQKYLENAQQFWKKAINFK